MTTPAPQPASSSAEFSRELRIYLRAAYPILYLVTHEEDRALNLLEAVLKADERLSVRPLFIWSLARRLCDAQNHPLPRQPADLSQLLPALKSRSEPGVFALLDFHHHLDAKRPESPLIIRQMRDLAANFKSNRKALVLISPVLNLPQELEKDVTILDLDPPDEGELGALLDRMAESQKRKPDVTIHLGFDLHLADGDSSAAPPQPASLVHLARDPQGRLDINVFDAKGRKVAARTEADLAHEAPRLESLKTQLAELWGKPLTFGQKRRVVAAVISLVDPTLENGAHEKIVKALSGLTQIEAENALAKVIVERGRLDPRDVDVLRAEKEQIIRKSQVLEFVSDPTPLSAVGGLDLLRTWLRTRKGRRADGSEIDCFSDAARRAGVPVPRGLLLVGVPGCGKSLSARAVATEWEMPLLRFDVGSVFGKFVGEAEQRMRSAIKMAEAVSPCVLWIDELEKAFAGARGPETDSGVTKRVFGSFLTWMSDKKKAVFVVATANDVASLPPELLRKGRFDETFYVTLPHPQERADILAIHLQARGRPHAAYDLGALAQATEGFSGAELEAVVVAAITAAYWENADGRLTDAHLLAAVQTVRPQALSPEGQRLLALLAEKAREGWRPASTPPPTAPVTGAELGAPVVPRDGARNF